VWLAFITVLNLPGQRTQQKKAVLVKDKLYSLKFTDFRAKKVSMSRTVSRFWIIVRSEYLALTYHETEPRLDQAKARKQIAVFDTWSKIAGIGKLAELSRPLAHYHVAISYAKPINQLC
jgi:hypothetical protein